MEELIEQNVDRITVVEVVNLLAKDTNTKEKDKEEVTQEKKTETQESKNTPEKEKIKEDIVKNEDLDQGQGHQEPQRGDLQSGILGPLKEEDLDRDPLLVNRTAMSATNNTAVEEDPQVDQGVTRETTSHKTSDQNLPKQKVTNNQSQHNPQSIKL